MMRDLTYETLHSPFNIDTHKAVFTNYLEVVILADGTVEYAVPSHSEKLIRLIMEKKNQTRDEVINSCPSIVDYFEWLMEEAEAIPVWDDRHLGKCNQLQLQSLYKLKSAGLYKGQY